CIRQYARDSGTRPEARAVFAIQLSIAEVQPRNEFRVPISGLARKSRRFCRMMDFVLEAWVSANIERAKASWILGNGHCWQPGQKLKLLFAGYNGTRNTGSDVRPEETLSQLRHILGAENVEFAAISQSFDMTRGSFSG